MPVEAITLQQHLQHALAIPGWRQEAELAALFAACQSLAADAVIVEVGVFMGRSTAVMAAARKLAGSGKVHAVDPFDASGDAFSVPHYRSILAEAGGGALQDHFLAHLQAGDLLDWVTVHGGTAEQIADTWQGPVDLVLLDGDQSPAGARSALDAWLPHLVDGGLLVVGNAPADGARSPGHDGNCRLARDVLVAPQFYDRQQLGSTLFVRKGRAG